jgi:hypothetical protein
LHCYFGWTEGNPIVYLFRYILFGEGDTPPVTNELLWEDAPSVATRDTRRRTMSSPRRTG